MNRKGKFKSQKENSQHKVMVKMFIVLLGIPFFETSAKEDKNIS